VAESIIVEGDLLDQPVDAIVNAWNRNFIPWWLLLPQGVSRAIKQRAGLAPFRELSKKGLLPLGAAVLTGAGRLPLRGIIHVAGLHATWRASERSIRLSVANALALAGREGFASVAMPLIGAGTGGGDSATVCRLIGDEVGKSSYAGRVVIVRYKKKA
jgi:O-acetyl-ADP-ribose deacetylase